MNNIKTNFSIKDLEHLTGIKAHTIRIWEKRYNLLQPNRSDTNIRNYSIESLQKLLNISFLNESGYKISKIAKMETRDIPILVRELASKGQQKHHAVNALKMAMLNFDQSTFYTTYNNLLQENTFKMIFHEVFIPLLKDIGILWQTNTINPAHEHFISTLIKQKVLINIEKVQTLEPNRKDKTFVLFLPMHEIHDIGLLYINYEIVCAGYQSIFLGQSIPIESLKDITKLYNTIVFGSYFTVKPETEDIQNYLQTFNDLLLKDTKHELFVLGVKLNNYQLPKENTQIKLYNSIDNFVKSL
ncbi:MAG: MerR family transcriptional regulator [Flavobacteriaceae bacterium]|nr:MerR family transcriptional regulator [Flavobacteriaceae bacterium]